MVGLKELVWDECDEREWRDAMERERNEDVLRNELEEWTGEQLEYGDWELQGELTLTREEIEENEIAFWEMWEDYAREFVDEFTRTATRDRFLQHGEIAAAWAANADLAGLHTTCEKYVELANKYAEMITQAVFDKKLTAEVFRRNIHGVKKIVPLTLPMLNDLKIDRRDSAIHLEIYVDRDVFRSWLQSSGQWPLSESCLLNKWLGNEDLEPTINKDKITTKKNDQLRLTILNEWYSDLHQKHGNNQDSVADAINGLTNEDIWNELKKFSPANKKILSIQETVRFIGKEGKNVWGFEKTKGNKPKK